MEGTAGRILISRIIVSVAEMGADRQQLQTATRGQQPVPGQPQRAERRPDGGGVQPLAYPTVEVHSQSATLARPRQSQPSPSRPRTARAGHALAPQRYRCPDSGPPQGGRSGLQGPRGTEIRQHNVDDDDDFHRTIYLTVSSSVQVLESESKCLNLFFLFRPVSSANEKDQLSFLCFFFSLVDFGTFLRRS